MPARRISARVARTLATALALGCADARTGPEERVASVDLGLTTARVEEGRAIQLVATPRDASGAAVSGVPITWRSSDTTIARVDASGLVIGHDVGTAVIVAEAGGRRGEVTVDVHAVYRDIAAGVHTCGRRSADRVFCWGPNLFGLVGREGGGNFALPVLFGQAPTIPAFYALVLGGDHACGLAGGWSADVYCWGSNFYAQLGIGTALTLDRTLQPVRVLGPPATFVALAVGRTHTCGLASGAPSDGNVYCWGDNTEGSTGTPGDPGAPVTVPTRVRMPDGAPLSLDTISAGRRFTCGVDDGRVACWGSNGFGQLGRGSAGGVGGPAFVALPGAPALAARVVSAGGFHACALAVGTRHAYCWGRNDRGQLGDGTTTDRSAPVAVVGPAGGAPLGFWQIVAMQESTCGVELSGRAYCWGDNQYGTLGVGTVGGTRLTPTQVHGGGGILYSTLSGRVSHVCGYSSSGIAYCWGRNDEGQLGDGTFAHAGQPVLVADQQGSAPPPLTAAPRR